MDRWFRLVWLIIGVMLLLLVVGGAGFVLVDAVSGPSSGSESAAPESGAAKPARKGADEPLRYDPPVAVRGSATRLVLIRHGSGYTYTSTASSDPRTGQGAVVNVAFLEGDSARLLLNQPAFIRRIAFPGHEAAPDSARPLRWIVYEIALRDTNGDGTIDDRDRRSLYVTGLDGRGLKQVLPDGYELRDWSSQPDGSLVATGLELAGGAKMAECAFIVDAAGTVRPYAALDGAVARAGRIIDQR